MKGKRFSTMSAAAEKRRLLAPVEPFKKHGESGATVSAFMPHTAKIADDLCFIKSMHTQQGKSCTGNQLFPLRISTPLTAYARIMAFLWSGIDERKSSNLCGYDLGIKRDELWPNILRLVLVFRVSPFAPPGRKAPCRRQPCSLP
jgi:hypothetical protein